MRLIFYGNFSFTFCFPSVLNYVEEKAFQENITLTNIRENLVASALARKGGCSLIFNEDPASRADYDYCLYKPQTGFAVRIDQQEDYFTTSMDGTLLMELNL